MLFISTSCKKDQTESAAASDNKKSSSITIQFKGKTFLIPYTKPYAGILKNIDGNTIATTEYLNSALQPVSYVGLFGYNKELDIDIGGNKRGDFIGVYKFEKYTISSKSYYFGVYQSGDLIFPGTAFVALNISYDPDFQMGSFTDLTDGNKEWDILHKTSTITVTKSDATKLEGSFSLDLKYGSISQKATGTFNIYK